MFIFSYLRDTINCIGWNDIIFAGATPATTQVDVCK